MKTIKVFHTHIEVHPYKLGEHKPLERMFSVYIHAEYKLEPIGYYIENDILYLPRGTSLSYLQDSFRVPPTIMHQADYASKLSEKIVMTTPPKNRIQEDAIDFLTSKNKFKGDAGLSQYGLTLDQGDGKTYSTVSAITKLNMKALIICEKTRIKKQWLETFRQMTTIKDSNIIDICSKKILDKIYKKELVADIYIINHQKLQAFVRENGWTKLHKLVRNMGIGIKVVDEAHYYFKNSLMIDFFTNVKKSFYITATFMRRPGEEPIFQRAYANVKVFGEETFSYEEKRKHIIFVIVYYHTRPSLKDLRSMRTKYGFSSCRYIDYELNDENDCMMRVIYRIMDNTENLKGKTLITSPKIDSSTLIARNVESITLKSVGTVHSKNDKAANEANIEKDIISSTVKSVGTGIDIKGLRILINTEPIGSKALADQVRGRLREFSPTEDTYLFYLVDTSIKETVDMLDRILPVMHLKCKEVYSMTMDDI